MSGDRDTAEERATFVVRLWRQGPAAAWRGNVEYVQLGEQRGAPDVGGVLRHLKQWIARIPARAKEDVDA